MSIIKCKMCGGDLMLLPDSTVAECEYCGTAQTVPSADSEKKLTLFARANRLRMACEFDKSAGVYEAIVADFPEEAEAYWGLVLCKYGIEYVDDPASSKKVPTCHRSSFDSVMDDSNYEQALENADVIARKVYRDEAKQIEKIRKGIVEVSSKEDPYDIFICYKETDLNGNRTLDSVLAQDIYNALTEKGYRVFFSRITLEDKLGQEYEPYIFAALNSAKIMLAVGTDYEHYNAVWVKNEWSRFLHMISAGQKKTLIPCYKNIDAYDMPKEFAKLQAQDLGKIGAMQDLLRGIEKIIGNAEPHKSSEYTIAQPFVPNNNSALLKRGFMALEDSDWARANEFFEKALDQDAECGEAYFGLYLAGNKLRSSVEFINNRLARTQTSQQEELEACSPSQEIDGIVNAYLIPGYFEPVAIRKLFDFPRTYISCVKGRKLQLEKEIEFFKVNKNLIRAGQYARGDFAVRFKQLQQDLFLKMKDRITEAESDAESQKKEVQQKYKSHIDAAKKKAKIDFEKFSQWREKDYQDILGQYHRAETSGDFRSLSLKFEAFKGYKESKKLAAECREKADKQAQKERQDAIIRREAEEKRLAAEKAEAERLRREEEARQAVIRRAAEEARIKQERIAKRKRILLVCCAIALIVTALIYIFVIVPAQKYQTAQELLLAGHADEALTIFEELASDNYKDSENQVNAIYYSKAEQLMNSSNFKEAMDLFSSLGEYKDSTNRKNQAGYAYAEGLLNNKKYDQAIEVFAMIGSYEDASLRIQEAAYLKAEELEMTGNKASAAMAFYSLGTYKDAQQRSAVLWTAITKRDTLAAGPAHVVCIRSDGTIDAIGYDKDGRCDVTSWTNIIAISAGDGHTVGLKEDGTVVAIGSNEYGQCDVSGWSDIVSISAGYYHTVGVRADGTVVATGYDNYGQCGVESWHDIVNVSAGYDFTAGLKADGTVIAVGDNYRGQCEVTNWNKIVKIEAGYQHVVGITEGGTVIAAGDNYSGNCDVEDWNNIIDISAGYYTTLGLKEDGTVVFSGNGMQGQHKVDNWNNVLAVCAGGSTSFGLKVDGSVVAIGHNSYGQCDVKTWRNIKQPR